MTTDNNSPSQVSPSEPTDNALPNSEESPQDSQPAVTSPGEPEASQEELLKAEVARLKEQLLRLAADFDNFRKRSRREIADAERMAREDLLREILPVFDNLERAIGHVGTATDVQSLADGIRMIGKQFIDTLSRLGVERVVTVGSAFDPSVHEAIQHLETAEQPPGCVAAEVLAGYRFAERLIRPAMVVVAKAPSDKDSGQ